MGRGTAAGDNWARYMKRQAVEDRRITLMDLMITGVTGLGGGQTRYDFSFRFEGASILVEVQATDYHDQRKDAQLLGQVIGCANNYGSDARFYKIIGCPRLIRRWLSHEAAKAAKDGDVFRPPTAFLY